MITIYDTHGLPQCGCEVLTFDTWYEMEFYLDDNPDLMQRLLDGYARLEEHSNVESV